MAKKMPDYIKQQLRKNESTRNILMRTRFKKSRQVARELERQTGLDLDQESWVDFRKNKNDELDYISRDLRRTVQQSVEDCIKYHNEHLVNGNGTNEVK